MISFTAFTPHPPVIIPEIGGGNIRYCQNTIRSMQKLASSAQDKDIDTIIFISPHTTLSPDNMIVSYNEKAVGDFAAFGHPEISYSSRVDLELAEEIIKGGKKHKLKVLPLMHDKEFVLDHGVLVPYFYLKPELNPSTEVIIIGFSNLSRSQHFAFGQVIAEIAEKSEKSIAILASGDLSHKNLDYGAEEIGQKFDKELVERVAGMDTAGILNFDVDLQEEAGECGYRSLLILLGALDGREIAVDVLSYEAPFGVGYMVAEFTTTQ